MQVFAKLVSRPSGLLLTLGLVVLGGLTASPARAQGFGGTVSDMLVRGDSLLAQGRANEAMVQYQEVRTLCPTPAETVSSLMGEARCLIRLEKLLPAAGLLEEAIADYPNDPRLADLLHMAGYTRYRAGDKDKAIEHLSRALESSPTTDIVPTIKVRLAKALRLSGRPREAVDLLADFASAHPGNPLLPNALMSLGVAQHDLGEHEAAEKSYRQIIEMFPDSQAAVEAHYELGVVLSDLGRGPEAAEFFQRYAAIHPESPIAARSLERAADVLLFRSPGESARLYGRASIMARTNPQPTLPELALSGTFGIKKAIAETLSRTWVVVLLVIVLIGGLAGLTLIGRRLMRRWRSADRVGAEG